MYVQKGADKQYRSAISFEFYGTHPIQNGQRVNRLYAIQAVERNKK